MNYNKIYKELYKKALNRKIKNGENHHFIPTSIFNIPNFKIKLENILGIKISTSNDNKNVVKLTLREHYIAHLLLIKIIPNSTGMLRAFNMMSVTRKGFSPNSISYESCKMKLKEKLKGTAMVYDENGKVVRLSIDEIKRRELKSVGAGKLNKFHICEFCGKKVKSFLHETQCKCNPNRKFRSFSKVCCLICKEEFSSSMIKRHICKIPKKPKKPKKPKRIRRWRYKGITPYIKKEIEIKKILRFYKLKHDVPSFYTKMKMCCIKCHSLVSKDCKKCFPQEVYLKGYCQYCGKFSTHLKHHESICKYNLYSRASCLFCKKEMSKSLLANHYKYKHSDITPYFLEFNGHKFYKSQFTEEYSIHAAMYVYKYRALNNDDHLETPCGKILYYTTFKRHIKNCKICKEFNYEKNNI